jgi:hypothetical protein
VDDPWSGGDVITVHTELFLSPLVQFISLQAISNNVIFALPDFMASANGRKSDSQRPRPLHLSKSFVEPPSPDRLTRNQRASTIQNGVIPENVMANVSRENARPRAQPDAFETRSEEDEDDTGTPIEGPGKLPDNFDELPIELASLSDTSVYSGDRLVPVLTLL